VLRRSAVRLPDAHQQHLLTAVMLKRLLQRERPVRHDRHRINLRTQRRIVRDVLGRNRV
jgi:hypothetical protein